jgi:tetratricopeptide (TPR) repeat protein
VAAPTTGSTLAAWPPPIPDELPARDPVRAAIDRAWRLPAASLDERVARTQRAGLALGLTSLDGPARSLLFFSGEGDALERAQHAVALSPTLPAAHAALAQARLELGDAPGAARAFRDALACIPLHLEARAWIAATASQAATYAALGFATLFLLLGAAASMPALVYGLGATRLRLAGPASLAALSALVMGLALVEGPAGAVLGLGVLAAASGGTMKRVGAALALAVAVAALHVGFERTAGGQLLLVSDPVAVAVHYVEGGLAPPTELGTVLRAAARDPAAGSAAALYAKRSGDRDAAAQYFARIAQGHPEAAVLNNAANVAFARGEVERAIALYEQAARTTPSATNYFNLSQAYGRAIRLDEQDRALATAQSLDPGVIERLTAGSGVGDAAFVSDATFPAAAVAARAAGSRAAEQLAEAARERIAPGWIGRSARLGGLAALAALVLAIAAGTALERAAGPRDFYADLARTLRAGAGDSAQRVAQLTRLRTQHARTERMLTLVALVVPGSAGFRFGRPLAALFASAAFASGVAVLHALRSAPLDPLAMGILPTLLVELALAACAAVYCVATAAAFVFRVED